MIYFPYCGVIRLCHFIGYNAPYLFNYLWLIAESSVQSATPFKGILAQAYACVFASLSSWVRLSVCLSSLSPSRPFLSVTPIGNQLISTPLATITGPALFLTPLSLSLKVSK